MKAINNKERCDIIMLRVVSSMKNNNALISTAMLTAIFEEKKQDTISLTIPFIINIINNDPTISNVEIAKKMQDEYSFSNFPQAIIKIVVNRLKKQKILKQENIFLFQMLIKL